MGDSQLDATLKLLKNTRFFSGVEDELLRQAFFSGEIKGYERGEIIYDEERYSRALGIILSGSAQVKKGRVIMSRLEKGDIFGAVTLYNESKFFVTQITAAARSRVLFLSKKSVSGLMGKDSRIAENFIAYLSERIYFLNGRIEAFTAGSAGDRLREYLQKNARDVNGNKTFTPNSIIELAKKLDLGRASLYRAIDELCEGGEIEKQGKTFYIKNLNKTEE